VNNIILELALFIFKIIDFRQGSNALLQAPRIRFEDLEQRYLRNFRDDAPMHYISEIHISKVFTNHL